MAGNQSLFRVKVVTSQLEGKKIRGTVRGHTLETDQSRAFGGEDCAPTPIEIFAFTLGACFVSTARLIAQIQDLDISAISATVTGTVDLAGAMGLNENARPGFPEFTITADFKAPWSTEQKQDFLDLVLKRCPVSDNLRNDTKVKVILSER